LPRKKILIVDDHRLFADGLSLMLSQLDPGLCISTEYNARLMLNDVASLTQYDAVLIDLDMPSFNGFDFLSAIRHREANVRVLIVSGSEKIADVENALRLGANGFVPKNIPSTEMLNAIQKVLAGQRYLPRRLAESVDWSACHTSNIKPNKAKVDTTELRPRQLEVLQLMHEGHSNAQIGTILGISESAVKSHISILFKALQTRNRTAAVKAGVELGLI